MVRFTTKGLPLPRPLLAIAAVTLLLGLPPGSVSAQDADPEKSVELVVDFGDGVQKRFSRLEWSEGMTVLDATELAARHPRGIKFKYQGKKATAFLTEIDGLKNQGAAGRNWIFRVNEELGKQSFALVALEAGDTILWKFGKYR